MKNHTLTTNTTILSSQTTGEVKEFCDPRIQQIKKTIEEVFDVDIHKHSLYFYGTKRNK